MAYIVANDVVGVFTLQVHVLTYKLLMVILQQYAGEQSTLAEDLEAIAHTQYLTTTAGKIDHLLHHRREAGQRPAAEVISVREAAWKHQAVVYIKHTEVTVFVPQHYYLLTQIITQGVLHITITIGAWENDNSEFHEIQLFTQRKLAINHEGE